MALTFRISDKLNIQDIEDRILRTYGSDIQKELENRTPGTAASQWYVSEPLDGKITISNETPFLPFLIEGTGIYGPRGKAITPKNSNLLSWVQGGMRIFAKSVRGIQPQTFVSDSIAAGTAAARGELNGNL